MTHISVCLSVCQSLSQSLPLSLSLSLSLDLFVTLSLLFYYCKKLIFLFLLYSHQRLEIVVFLSLLAMLHLNHLKKIHKNFTLLIFLLSFPFTYAAFPFNIYCVVFAAPIPPPPPHPRRFLLGLVLLLLCHG